MRDRLKKLAVALGGLLTLISAFFALFWMNEAKTAKRKADDQEFERHKAEAEVERIQSEQNRDVALRHVETKYQKELQALDDEQKKTAKELRSDPVALSSFLVDAGRRKRR